MATFIFSLYSSIKSEHPLLPHSSLSKNTISIGSLVFFSFKYLANFNNITIDEPLSLAPMLPFTIS